MSGIEDNDKNSDKEYKFNLIEPPGCEIVNIPPNVCSKILQKRTELIVFALKFLFLCY